MYTRSTELFHAGTKGMKWGRRLYQNKDGSLTALGRMRYGKGKGKTKAELEKEKAKAAKKAAKTEAKASKKAEKEEAEKLRKKSTKEMTDQELREKIARYKLEEEYGRLKASVDPEKKSKVKEIGQSIVEKAINNIGEQAVTYAFGYAVNQMGSRIFNDPEIVNPYKGQGTDPRMKSAGKNKDKKKDDD